MPIPITFVLFLLVIAGMIFGFDNQRKERIFAQEVLIARDLSKVCDSGQPTDRDCARVRLVAQYGPQIPDEELGWVKVCDERKKVSSLSFSQAFFDRCQKARVRVIELNGKAASVQNQKG